MNWLNQSLFRRLFISFLLIFLLGFSAIGLVIAMTTTDYITSQQKQEILNQARSVNGAIQMYDTVSQEVKDTIETLGQFSHTTIWVINQSGEIIATSSNQEIFVGELINDTLLTQIMNGHHSFQVMDIEGEERPMLSVVVPWGTAEEIKGGIILHSPISGIKSTVRNIREIVLWASIGGLVIAATMVSYLSWSISKPLRKVEETANEIALGNYSGRVQHNIPDEVGQLVNSFNRMAEKLDTIEKERDLLEERRKDFIASISHELRTPLTAMKGFLEALQDGLVHDVHARQKYYQIMYRETEYLTYLVNDLMDLIKLEKKEIHLDLYFIELEEVIKKVVLHFQRELETKGNTLHITNTAVTSSIIGDSLRLEQVFKNIIDNANKFTDGGEIHIDITSAASSVIVEIKDTGIGIPSHDLERVWDRFFKVDRVRSKKGRGTGLGLAIVKELVMLHGGEIVVTSELGKGTAFTMKFPIKQVSS